VTSDTAAQFNDPDFLSFGDRCTVVITATLTLIYWTRVMCVSAVARWISVLNLAKSNNPRLSYSNLKFEIWYMGALGVCRGRAMIEIHLPWNTRWKTAPNFQSSHRYNSAADCSKSSNSRLSYSFGNCPPSRIWLEVNPNNSATSHISPAYQISAQSDKAWLS